MQGDNLHTHSISVSVGMRGHINPCGEIELDPNDRCNLSLIRPVGEPIGFMVDEWTALDEILYALKEDELAEKHGREKATQMIAAEKIARSRKFYKDFFDWASNHTHYVGYRPAAGVIAIK